MNIRYQSSEIGEFYSQHRSAWKEFYPSERFVFERVATEAGQIGRVLDVGGAAGGLGRALAERFGLAAYTCVDINTHAIAAGKARQREIQAPTEFLCDDIVSRPAALHGRTFDLVTCLSCADWNLQPEQTIGTCWDFVAPGGRMVLSLRLTDGDSVNDMTKSYQFIKFGSAPLTGSEEQANYVVLNARKTLGLCSGLQPHPARLLAYGYWGKPSAFARTPFQRIAFTVLALTKGETGEPCAAEIHLPLELLLKP